jgi:hypothetical protein
MATRADRDILGDPLADGPKTNEQIASSALFKAAERLVCAMADLVNEAGRLDRPIKLTDDAVVKRTGMGWDEARGAASLLVSKQWAQAKSKYA